MALCFIPGLIVFGLLMLAIPLVSEGRLPATGAMIQSWHALKSQWLTAAVFHWVLFILAGSAYFLCFVGVLFTGPLYCLSVTILYHNFFGWAAHLEEANRPIPRGLISPHFPRKFGAGLRPGRQLDRYVRRVSDPAVQTTASPLAPPAASPTPLPTGLGFTPSICYNVV